MSERETIRDFWVTEFNKIDGVTEYDDGLGVFRSTLKTPVTKLVVNQMKVSGGFPFLSVRSLIQDTYQDGLYPDNLNTSIDFLVMGFFAGQSGTANAQGFATTEADKLIDDVLRVIIYNRLRNEQSLGWMVDTTRHIRALPVYDYEKNYGWFSVQFSVLRPNHCDNNL